MDCGADDVVYGYPGPVLPAAANPAPSTQAAASAIPGFDTVRPPLPSTTTQYFFPVNVSTQQAVLNHQQRMGARAIATGQPMLAYQPYLVAQASVRIVHVRSTLCHGPS